MKLAKISDVEFDKLKRDYPVARVCPTCLGELHYRLDSDEHLCDCMLQRNLQKHYFNANIGRRYHTLGLDDFDTPDTPVVRPLVENYLKNFEHNYRYGLGFVFWGGLGTGKTLVACHVLKRAIQSGYTAYFVQFDDLIDTWGSRWSDDESSRVLQYKMKRADITVIDDLSVDKRNVEGFLQSGLEAVVRYRYNNNLPTLVTTNLTQDQQNVQFPRVFSLLSAVNEWVEMRSSVDYRPNEYRERLYHLRDAKEALPIT